MASTVLGGLVAPENFDKSFGQPASAATATTGTSSWTESSSSAGSISTRTSTSTSTGTSSNKKSPIGPLDLKNRGGENFDGSSTSTPQSSSAPGTPLNMTPMATTTITTTVTRPKGDGSAPQTSQTTSSITHLGSGALAVSHELDPKAGTALIHAPAYGPDGKKTRYRTVVTFRERLSQFDRLNPQTSANPFWGFHTLFWIGCAMYLIRTGWENYARSQSLLLGSFLSFLNRDAWMLIISDGILVGLTFLCVPFIKMVIAGWVRYDYAGCLIHHFFQTIYLLTAIWWAFYRDWPWVQSGFFVLHSLSMLMKIHSYCAYNGWLSEKARQLKKLRAKLDVSDEDHADNEAGPQQPTTMTSGMQLRKRRKSQSPTRGAVSEADKIKESVKIRKEIHDLEDVLKGPNGQVVWPQNVSLYNFADFLIIPTLIYELEYPRNEKIRWGYVVEKIAATAGTFLLLYTIIEQSIMPYTPKGPITVQKFITATLNLLLPFMINYILIFYIIFECICNGFAELSRFADREFYQDWWNSVTWDEFARKWNKPVHQFLLRHVYFSSIEALRLRRRDALIFTFLLSSLIHEMVMAIVTKKLRPYLFVCQMAQIPFMWLGRQEFVKSRRGLANTLFWIGLMSGPPLLGCAYLAL